jgi:hypothetical protein
MKYEKIIMVIVVMILLVMSISIAKDETSASYTKDDQTYPYNYQGAGQTSPSYHTESPGSGIAYRHITGSAGNWNLAEYDKDGKQTSSYSSENTNAPAGHSTFAWGNPTGGMGSVDTNRDGEVNDEDRGNPRFVDYVGGKESNGFVYQGRVYDTNGNYRGSNYDSKTGTYEPDRNGNIRVDAAGNVFTDIDGDGDIDIHDMDSDGDGKPDAGAAASPNYNHQTGRYEVDWGVGGQDRYVGPDGSLYAASSGGDAIGSDFRYYPESDSYTYDPAEDPRPGWHTRNHHMVIGGNLVTLPGSTDPAFVRPDGQGGYYIGDVPNVNVNANDDMGIGGDEYDGTRDIHYVVTAQGTDHDFVGVIDGATTDIIFIDDNRDGKQGRRRWYFICYTG